MTDIEVMQQALEALRSSTNYRSGSAIQVEAVENLCEALEQPEPEPVVPPELEAHFRHLDALKQPEQEPVAWGLFEGDLYDMFFTQEEALDLADMKGTYADVRPLYTTPPVAQPQQEPVAVKHCVTFLMHGENMAFKIGNQQFTLDYQPSEPGEFEFMENCLIQALHHFTLSVQSTPPAAQPEQEPCQFCGLTKCDPKCMWAEPVVSLPYHPCTGILIAGLKDLHAWDVLHEWDKARKIVDDGVKGEVK